MKKISTLFGITFLNVFIFSSVSLAWISTPEINKEYNFKFKPFQGEVYTYQTSSSSQEEAFEKAAQSCFNHYKKGRRISMDYGQDIIDICVNPRNL